LLFTRQQNPTHASSLTHPNALHHHRTAPRPDKTEEGAPAGWKDDAEGYLFGKEKETPQSAAKKRKAKKSETEEDFNAEDSYKKSLKQMKQEKGKKKTVELLSYKHIQAGTMLLGAVREIRHFGLTISLPNQLNGIVMYDEVSDSLSALSAKSGDMMEDDDEDSIDRSLPNLTDMFTEGELIRCSVISVDRNSNRVELTMRPSVINAALDETSLEKKGAGVYGCVRSIEDRGAVISLGINGLTGFLEGKAAAALKVGKPIECAVSKNSKSRAITLSIETGLVSKALKDTSNLSFSALQPGSMVRSLITQASNGAYSVDILGEFAAVIDRYHTNPEESHSVGDRVLARVLCVDDHSKQCYLTLNPDILDWRTASVPARLKIGTVIPDAIVTKVDQGMGLRLELPVKKAASGFPAYCHIGKIADGRIEKITGDHGEGTEHPARIVAFNRLDGIAVVTLQASVIEEPLMMTSDVVVGEIYKGVVKDFNKGGIRVQLSKNVIGFIPTTHLSDKKQLQAAGGVAAMEAKYRPGTKLKLRAMRVDEEKRSVVLTHRGSLVKNELPVLKAYEEAVPGGKHLGVVLTVKDMGTFVSFYGNVKGMIPASDYTNTEFKTPAAGDAIECYVNNCNVSSERLRLSLTAGDTSSAGGHLATKDMATFDAIELGDLRKGKVISLIDGAVIVDVGGGITGTLPVAQLSDHRTTSARILESLSEGNEIGQVMVLRKDHERRRVTLTRKSSLIKAAEEGLLTDDIDDVTVGDVLSGYVKSVSKHGCFVGLLGDLTGLAHKSSMADAFVADPADFFLPGDSITMSVLELTEGRMKVSTKVSECQTDTSVLAKSYFEDEKFILSLKNLNGSATEVARDDSVWKQLSLGANVEGQVYTVADYGVVLSLIRDVVGFVKAEQAGDDEHSAGDVAQGRVLDVSREKGIVDLSLKPAHLSAGGNKATGKKRKAGSRLPGVGEKVSGLIELVKEDYVVVSLTEHDHALCYVASRHPNETGRDVHSVFKHGQKVALTTRGHIGDRMLGQIHENEKTKREKKSKTEKGDTSNVKLSLGETFTAQVTDLLPTAVELSLDGGAIGRMHVSQLPKGKTLAKLSQGDSLQVKILNKSYGKNGRFYDVTGKEDFIKSDGVPELDSISEMKVGETIKGWVESVDANGMWVTVAPGVRGQIRGMDASEDVSVVRDLKSNFKEGMLLKACRVISVDNVKNRLDLTLLKASSTLPRVGTIRTALVTKVNPGVGLNIKLAGGIQGRVFLTDISDDWKKDPTKEFEVGQTIEGTVAEVNRDHGTPRVELSLRESKMNKELPPVSACPDITSATELDEGQVVHGYVTNISAKGCFVAVSRKVTARVKISELADKYLENLTELFPPGKLVEGRVMTVDPESERVEMSLKLSVVRPQAGLLSFSDMQPDMEVRGTVKKVHSFGVFVNIANSNLTGLAHLSELSDAHVADPKALFTPGDAVKAFVLRTDSSNQHISLSLKASYFTEGDEDLTLTLTLTLIEG